MASEQQLSDVLSEIARTLVTEACLAHLRRSRNAHLA
jgi:hypothetical protein